MTSTKTFTKFLGTLGVVASLSFAQLASAGIPLAQLFRAVGRSVEKGAAELASAGFSQSDVVAKNLKQAFSDIGLDGEVAIQRAFTDLEKSADNDLKAILAKSTGHTAEEAQTVLAALIKQSGKSVTVNTDSVFKVEVKAGLDFLAKFDFKKPGRDQMLKAISAFLGGSYNGSFAAASDKDLLEVYQLLVVTKAFDKYTANPKAANETVTNMATSMSPEAFAVFKKLSQTKNLTVAHFVFVLDAGIRNDTVMLSKVLGILESGKSVEEAFEAYARASNDPEVMKAWERFKANCIKAA